MAGYDIAELIRTKKDTAHIEYFFTQKGKTLYCIVPSYTNNISIKNFKPAVATRVSLLGRKKVLAWKQSGNDCMIDLNSLKPDDLSNEIFVVKLENAL